MSHRDTGKSKRETTSTTRRAVWVQDFGADLLVFRDVTVGADLRAEALERMRALLFGHSVPVTLERVDGNRLEVRADVMTDVPSWLVEYADVVVCKQAGKGRR